MYSIITVCWSGYFDSLPFEISTLILLRSMPCQPSTTPALSSRTFSMVSTSSMHSNSCIFALLLICWDLSSDPLFTTLDVIKFGLKREEAKKRNQMTIFNALHDYYKDELKVSYDIPDYSADIARYSLSSRRNGQILEETSRKRWKCWSSFCTPLWTQRTRTKWSKSSNPWIQLSRYAHSSDES